LKEKAKRDGNTEVTEGRTQRTERTARKREKKRGDAEDTEFAEKRIPKTQAHAPCLGHPQGREKRKRDPSTTRFDAPEGGAKEKIGPLRSG
jgi:hypothetical protein